MELYGTRPVNGSLSDDWNLIQDIIRRRNLTGKVRPFEDRVSHKVLMSRMATASGLVHFANSDRNPRILYEALYFGLPLFVTIQSMPYVGLQCQPFVTLADADVPAAAMNAQFKAWTDYLSSSAIAERQRNTTTSVQQHIRRYVEDHVVPSEVYLNLCQRFGLCEVPNAADADVWTPWAQRGKPCATTQALWRYDNWERNRWNASKRVRSILNITKDRGCKPLRITRRNCEDQCVALNRRDRLTDARRPWWLPHFVRDIPAPEHHFSSPSYSKQAL